MSKKKQSFAVHDEAALQKMLVEKKNELAGLRFQASSKALRQVNKINAVRRDIARIETALSQK